MKQIEAVLLDIDGTLVQRNDAHAWSWCRALRERGHSVYFSDLRPLIGMGSDKLLPIISGISAESAEGRKIDKRRAALFLEEYIPTLQPTLGAETLLEDLKNRGFKLAIASSAKKQELESLLKICQAERLIDSSTSSD